MKILLTFGLLCLIQFSYAQKKFNFEKIDVEGMYQIETENESEFIDTIVYRLSIDNFSSLEMKRTKTFIFKRIHDRFTPNLHVWYHVEENSNNVIAITYNWDFYNPGFNPNQNRDLLVATNKRESEYQKLYKEVNIVLKDVFTDSLKTNLISDSDFSFSEMTYYESSQLFAYSRIRFQRKIVEIPIIGLANNHFVVQMVVVFK